MLIRKDHLNMIRQIAWSFHYTTGIEYEELFSTGCLEWCEAILVYDDDRKTSLSTYAYTRVQKYLINYVKSEHLRKTYSLEEVCETKFNFSPDYEFYQRETIKGDTLKAFNLILSQSENFEDVSSKMARNILRRKLKGDKSWTWERVWNAIRNLKEIINHPDLNCIIYNEDGTIYDPNEIPPFFLIESLVEWVAWKKEKADYYIELNEDS